MKHIQTFESFLNEKLNPAMENSQKFINALLAMDKRDLAELEEIEAKRMGVDVMLSDFKRVGNKIIFKATRQVGSSARFPGESWREEVSYKNLLDPGMMDYSYSWTDLNNKFAPTLSMLNLSENVDESRFDNFGDAALSEYLDEIIMLAAEYTDEDLESLSGQVPRSADDAVKMVLDYIPAKDKKKFLSQVDKIEKP